MTKVLITMFRDGIALHKVNYTANPNVTHNVTSKLCNDVRIKY